MIRTALAFVLLCASLAYASGPITPPGWDDSPEPTLPSGQSCCLPADLNGTGLIGGAFVLLSPNKQTFGIFALSYTPPLKERWQLLEKHPISQLANFSVAIEPPGRFPLASIKVCTPNTQCHFYYYTATKGSFKRSNVENNAR